MKVKRNTHQAFIAAVSEACSAKDLAFDLRRTKSGYIVRAGNAWLTWHRSQSPWHCKNIRRLGLDAVLTPRQP
ncbi:MAG: hypothetical protein KBA75_09925 [Alphaproteobacteria bacterium]|nr:hypothetical protein [Alphaproteobacteria bacterium]